MRRKHYFGAGGIAGVFCAEYLHHADRYGWACLVLAGLIAAICSYKATKAEMAEEEAL